jgi:hypothetical protein
VFGFSFSIINEVFFPPRPSSFEQLFVLPDGTPIVKRTRYSGSYNAEETYRLRDGTPWKPPRHFAEAPKTDLRGDGYLTGRFEGVPRPMRVLPLGFGGGETLWYFVDDGELHGHGYFVGYDATTKLKVGCLGRKGFQAAEPSIDDQFPVNGHKVADLAYLLWINPSQTNDEGRSEKSDGARCYLLADDGLIQVDLTARTVRMMRKGDNLISAGQSWRPQTKTSSAEPKDQPVILLRTPDRVLVLDLNGKEIQAYHLPAAAAREYLEWFQLPDDKALVYTPYSGGRLYWIDAAGRVSRQERVVLQQAGSRARKKIEYAATGFIVPSPGALGTFITIRSCFGGSEEGFVARLHWWAGEFRVALLITAVVSIILAALCYRRQRKYALPWTAAWIVFVLLFGLPAYLGYLAHRFWPGRLACPNYGRLAPRDRPACFACGQEFPAPPPKGIEVFS